MSETRSACCRHERQLRRRQQGVALLLVLLIAITLGLAFFFRPGNDGANRFTRERTSEDALTQACAQADIVIGNVTLPADHTSRRAEHSAFETKDTP